jgi:glycosyltransferase involved in cell wall biosynthesis
MNILHIGKYYFPDKGGIENVTQYLAQGTVRAGHKVTVLCFGTNKKMSDECIEGVLVVRAPTSALWSSQPLGLGYVSRCIQLAGKSDIVHLHTPNILASLCVLFFGPRVRLLVYWHSDVLNKGVIGRICSVLESAMLRRADCIVTSSLKYAEASKPLAPFLDKVSVIPIGVPDAWPVADTSPIPAILSRRIGDKRIVLSVGRLVPYKGFDVLINAAQALSPEAIVVIVGDGPLQSKLEKAIRVAGVTDRVILAGRLSPAALQALFGQASLFCLPSNTKAEAFGVVLLEAMTYGLPIVATNIPGSGVSWVNHHEHSGLNVSINSPQQLAEACNRILECPLLHDRLRQGSRLRYLDQFQEKTFIKRMIAVYHRMLEKA